MIDVQDKYFIIPKGWRFQHFDEYAKELKMHVIFTSEYESEIYFTGAVRDIIGNVCDWDSKVFAGWDDNEVMFALKPSHSREARKFILREKFFDVYESVEGTYTPCTPSTSTVIMYEWIDADVIDVGAMLRTVLMIDDDIKGFSAKGFWNAKKQILSFDLQHGLKTIKDGENWWLND